VRCELCAKPLGEMRLASSHVTLPACVRSVGPDQIAIVAELLDDSMEAHSTYSVRCSRKTCPASEEWIVFDPSVLVSRAREAFANRRAGEAVSCRFPMQGESV